tara:strand:- start:1851 stop:2087 length:237 start_codon:yes stop_codon:yes gene_type:complete
MSNYEFKKEETIFNNLGESIYIIGVTPQFIYFDSYDDCGDLWRKNLKRKVYYDGENHSLFIRADRNFIFTLRYSSSKK